jgi:dolichol-phosphate mannosyltransferase
MRISVAIPVYNESSVLPELLARIGRVLDTLPGGSHEIVCVDDGSTDGTWEILKEVAGRDPRVVAVSLSRNFGHQAAFSAALDYVSGDAVVLMDGDLQDPPEAIPQLLEAYQQGYDVVYVVRVKRKEGVVLRFCYYLFYALIAMLADVRLPRGAGDFCLISRRVVDELSRTQERMRYLRGLRTWVGFRQIGIPVERARRHSGVSKYSPRRLLKLAFDGIFAFSIVPIRAATLLGAVTILVSIGVAGYSVAAKLFFDRPPQGFTALIVSIAFFAGTQLVFLGVIGEYIGRIYEEVKARPVYIVKETLRSRRLWTQNTPEPIETCTVATGGGGHESI